VPADERDEGACAVLFALVAFVGAYDAHEALGVARLADFVRKGRA